MPGCDTEQFRGVEKGSLAPLNTQNTISNTFTYVVAFPRAFKKYTTHTSSIFPGHVYV